MSDELKEKIISAFFGAIVALFASVVFSLLCFTLWALTEAVHPVATIALVAVTAAGAVVGWRVAC